MTQESENSSTDSRIYKTLLESTKAIPWKINWSNMRFEYIGPQIEDLLGWTPDSWHGVDEWAARMHPDDRDRVVNFCVSQSQAGVDHEADYRALNKDGDYVWIRDVVHVVRDQQGNVEALIGFMFDISERKKSEAQLIQLQQELEELSYKDGLTGVANRRQFDKVMESEWANARRNQQPLSLLLIDIDYFKPYNDHFGHIKGDEVLQQVAATLAESIRRPRDLVSRYGGEEFVLVLPETDQTAAMMIAEKCRQAVLALNIDHPVSSADGVLSISIGAGCTLPGAADDAKDFIQLVDQRLYCAKAAGRNCVCAEQWATDVGSH